MNTNYRLCMHSGGDAVIELHLKAEKCTMHIILDFLFPCVSRVGNRDRSPLDIQLQVNY